jgi:hypothetical protein
MKKLIVLLTLTLSLFAVDKATFPNDDMNIVISGVFLDDSSYINNRNYQKLGDSLIRTINNLNKSNDFNSYVKKAVFKPKNSKELSIFQVAEQYQFDKQKLISALSDQLKPNTLKIGIKFIPDDNNLRLDVYRIYNEDKNKLPLIEFLSMSFPKNSNYSSVVKYLIFSDFQDFSTKKRDNVAPTLIKKDGKFIIKFYSNDLTPQKYFIENVKKRNIKLLNKLKITNIDLGFSFSDNAEVYLADAKKYCALYNMKLPDLSLISDLGKDSFSEDGLYKLDDEKLKIYVPATDGKNSFLCVGRSVKEKSEANIEKLTLPKDKWPKIFSDEKEVNLTNIKYEVK